MPYYCKACPTGSKPIRILRKDTLCGGCVKQTGVKNPPRPGQSTVNRDAKRTTVKLEKQIQKAARIGIDYRAPTEAEKDAAFTKAKEEFDAKLLEVKTLLPDREVFSSITLHAERSLKKFDEECVDGSLVGGALPNRDDGDDDGQHKMLEGTSFGRTPKD